MSNIDYSNIEQKTIFDFCKDQEVLKFITQTDSPSVSEYLKHRSREEILLDLKELAFIIGSDELEAAVYPLLPAIIDWDNRVFDFKEKQKLLILSKKKDIF